MGVTGLLKQLKCVSRPIHLKDISCSTVAVDVSAWLYRGAYSCSWELGTGQPTTKYLDFVGKMIDLLESQDIKPIFVFDGKSHPAKSRTQLTRRESRQATRLKALEKLDAGEVEEAKKLFSRCYSVSEDMVESVFGYIEFRGFETIRAPFEGILCFVLTSLID